ncbi:MAG TPA: alkaline phosphatase family protein, partial [Dermatophilaceae bacterium]|nr:alkaline phosphatase family protein [Dermatophilaceae bacterium]
IVVSPYARAHFVSHTVYDHTSLTRFIEARFGLPALTARDANATPPFEMFDFKNPPFMTPPDIKATTTVPQAILTQCNQTLAPLTCGM